jgi:hypothetical protein
MYAFMKSISYLFFFFFGYGLVLNAPTEKYSFCLVRGLDHLPLCRLRGHFRLCTPL